MDKEQEITGVCVDIRKLIDDLKIVKNTGGGLASAMAMIAADVRYSFRESDSRFWGNDRFVEQSPIQIDVEVKDGKVTKAEVIK